MPVYGAQSRHEKMPAAMSALEGQSKKHLLALSFPPLLCGSRGFRRTARTRYRQQGPRAQDHEMVARAAAAKHGPITPRG
jgi:hypothetical protein